jgi:hypothetical protein
MLKEFFERLISFATDQNKLEAREIVFLRGNNRRFYSIGGVVESASNEEPGWRHEIYSVESLAEFATHHAGDKPQLWIGPRGVVYEFEHGDHLHAAVLKLELSPQWMALLGFSNGVSLKQSDAIRLFRVHFQESPESPAIVDAIRAIRVTATTDSTEETARIGKSIAREAVASRIPDSVLVRSSIWNGVSFFPIVKLFLAPDLERPGNVLIDTDGGAIDAAEQTGLDYLHSYFKESGAVESIFIGTPKYILSPSETKGHLDA